MMFSLAAHAGFIEIGATANYRSSQFDKNNFSETISYTASYAYYFFEQCAAEFSYTSGYSKQVSKASTTDPKYTTEDNIDLASLDLVLSFAGREDLFQPYVKVGGGYLKKERFFQVDQMAKNKIKTSEGFVPSAGIGFKILLTKGFSIKVGVDGWSTPLNEEPVVFDYVGRAGISWMF